MKMEDAQRSQLLLIDVQERLIPEMRDAEACVETLSHLLQGAELLEVPTLVSEQYPAGLGPTIAPLLDQCGRASVFAKRHFSCAADTSINDHILSHAKCDGRRHVVLAGIEAHVCVLLTEFDLLAQGYDVTIVADAVTSRFSSDRDYGLEAARAHGALVLPLETVLFGWCKTSAHLAFKPLSALIKQRGSDK